MSVLLKIIPMKRYYFPDDKEAKQGKSEDPPNNVTKQNDEGDNKDKKEDIDVPDEAVKNYKESAPETEE